MDDMFSRYPRWMLIVAVIMAILAWVAVCNERDEE